MKAIILTQIEPILHYTIVFCGIIAIAIWLIWGFLHKSRRNYILTPVLYLSHLLLFYIITMLNLISKPIYILWTDLVFLHSVIVLISAGMVMLQLVGKEEK